MSRSGLFSYTTSNKGISVRYIIEIIIPLISWLDFVICGFIKNFLPNPYFILQIYHAKSLKMRHVSSLFYNTCLHLVNCQFSWALKFSINNFGIIACKVIGHLLIFFALSTLYQVDTLVVSKKMFGNLWWKAGVLEQFMNPSIEVFWIKSFDG